MMMLILRGRIVQSGRRHRSMKLMCLEIHRLDKFFKRNKLHQHQNPHAKIFYIRKLKELGKPKEGVYQNQKIIQVVKTYWELGHEHKFITEIVTRRANKVLEGLKSYNNDIKYGYVQKDLTKDEAEYLKLFEEEIEERLKHHRQMRRWEMFVNGRPLGPQRERPE
ncbi:hypothetical protein Tco_1222030 [Tanacetum coccineum]